MVRAPVSWSIELGTVGLLKANSLAARVLAVRAQLLPATFLLGMTRKFHEPRQDGYDSNNYNVGLNDEDLPDGRDSSRTSSVGFQLGGDVDAG